MCVSNGPTIRFKNHLTATNQTHTPTSHPPPQGADVTLRDEEGYTPLMYAAFYAREQVREHIVYVCVFEWVCETT